MKVKNFSRYGIGKREESFAEQHGGDVDTLTDFRAICNYVIKF